MRAINSGIRNAGRPANLKPIAKRLVVDIKERTREGKEVKETQGDRSNIETGKSSKATIPVGKFKALKGSTVRRRRQSKRYGKLSPITSPTISNQTQTNAMVGSLTDTTTKNLIVLSVGNKQKKKLEENVRMGRNFLKLSKNNLKMIAVDVVSFIAKAIERDIK